MRRNKLKANNRIKSTTIAKKKMMIRFNFYYFVSSLYFCFILLLSKFME